MSRVLRYTKCEALIGQLLRLRVGQAPRLDILPSPLALHPARHFSKDPVQEFNEELQNIFGPSLDADTPLTRAPHPDNVEKFGDFEVEQMEDARSSLTHVDRHGRASMVDVSGKLKTFRTAVASGKVFLGQAAYSLLSENKISKGDVLTVAKIAGIMGSKQTSNLIPLCHSISLSKVDVEFALEPATNSVKMKAVAKTSGQTGVEMEALTSVAVAALTVYDMCKAVSKDIEISNIVLESKSGGKSGDWQRGQG